MYPQYMCILLICDILFGVTVFHGVYCQLEFGVEYMYPQYMCILLYLKVIWCNTIPYIYFQLEWGVYVSLVYVHSAICDRYLV